MRNSLWTLGVLAAGAVGWLAWSAEEPSRDIYTEEARDATLCTNQLLVLKEALQAYRSANNDRWPSKLSELVPDYLADKQFLMCPYVRDAAVYKEWRLGIRGDVFPEPDLTTYAYEFCDQPWGTLKNQGLIATVRDYKQRQMALLESRRTGAGKKYVPVVRCLAHRPILNLSFGGWVYPSSMEWEENVPPELATHDELVPEALFAKELEEVRLKALHIPRRAGGLSARLVDLTEHYNASLTEPMHGGAKGNDLSELGVGLVKLKEIPYDVRGMVQLKGRELASYPQERTGIRVNQSCQKLHFLHATAYGVATNTVIAHYRVRYANGTVESIPVVYGKDVLDWWADPKDAVAARLCDIAWEGGNRVTRINARVVRLYHSVWKNPFPLERIQTIDFASVVTDSAPFLLAVTVE